MFSSALAGTRDPCLSQMGDDGFTLAMERKKIYIMKQIIYKYPGNHMVVLLAVVSYKALGLGVGILATLL